MYIIYRRERYSERDGDRRPSYDGPPLSICPSGTTCRTSPLTEPPACDSGEDTSRTRTYVYTQKRASRMCICTQARCPRSISSHSRIQYRAGESLDSWILDDCVSREKSPALSPARLQRRVALSRRARSARAACGRNETCNKNTNVYVHIVKCALRRCRGTSLIYQFGVFAVFCRFGRSSRRKPREDQIQATYVKSRCQVCGTASASQTRLTSLSKLGERQLPK